MCSIAVFGPGYSRKVHGATTFKLDKKELPLIFVCGGPGVGKSRLLVQLANWLPDALADQPAVGGAGGPGLGKGRVGKGSGGASATGTTVVLMIKSGNGMSLSVEEQQQDGNHLLACRMLYSAFCADEGVSYTAFYKQVCGECPRVTFEDAAAMICHALGDVDITLVVLVDEAHELCVNVSAEAKVAYPYVHQERHSSPFVSLIAVGGIPGSFSVAPFVVAQFSMAPLFLLNVASGTA